MYHFNEDTFMVTNDIEVNDPEEVLEKNALFDRMMKEFNAMSSSR